MTLHKIGLCNTSICIVVVCLFMIKQLMSIPTNSLSTLKRDVASQIIFYVLLEYLSTNVLVCLSICTVSYAFSWIYCRYRFANKNGIWSLQVLNCHESAIYILAPLRYATIYGCSDATIVIGAVGKVQLVVTLCLVFKSNVMSLYIYRQQYGICLPIRMSKIKCNYHILRVR